MSGYSRRDFLSMSGGALLATKLGPSIETDEEFLRNLVLTTLEGSRVQPGSHGPKGWPIENTCGFALVTPGRLGYPAFWIRDFSMAADSGLMPTQEIEEHLLLIARCQNGANRRYLKSGAVLPPYCIPDHINFDGKPVYYPGTYSSGEDQGGEPFGTYPPVDDHYEFVHIAWLLAKQKKDRNFLQRFIGNYSLRSRLELAFFSPAYDPNSELVVTREALRAVGFGFCDSVTLSGMLLYPSLLRFRAATELSELTGDAKYTTVVTKLLASIRDVFLKSDGWLYASTGVGSGQPDVWGTLLALNLGAISDQAVFERVADSYVRGTITIDSAVRHVPTDHDFSEKSAWEKALTPKGIYQNGAYWHTPTGWLIAALARVDLKLAKRAFKDYIAHLRKGGDRPWECFNPTLNHYQNGGYLASVALPYSVLQGFTYE
ncbi:MAG: hypothetical protein JST12_00015 [Armatimonadetes bacterium]|nr:hypothetical protein [Armatimonadota bacterium]